tara:strand:+ start:4136 stop:4996 length:861 start_codon:yes stop_codon:yes gene_type:complete
MPTRQRTISFLPGFSVKPSRTSELGTIFFTDGTNEIIPNQVQCEAYGYTYDKVSGTCSVYRYNTNLNRAFSNLSNDVSGAGNSTQTGTTNTYIMGENNVVRGFSRNNIVTGSGNEIANGINNVSISGMLGEATASNSIVLGGNATGDLLGERQIINCMYGRQTTNSITQASYLNAVTGEFFIIPENTACYFHAEVLALRVGGVAVAGAVGDFASWIERGVVINKSGTLSIVRERDTIKSSGTVTNWLPTAAVGTDNFKINTRGQTGMVLEWSINVRFTQMKTTVTL